MNINCLPFNRATPCRRWRCTFACGSAPLFLLPTVTHTITITYYAHIYKTRKYAIWKLPISNSLKTARSPQELSASLFLNLTTTPTLIMLFKTNFLNHRVTFGNTSTISMSIPQFLPEFFTAYPRLLITSLFSKCFASDFKT